MKLFLVTAKRKKDKEMAKILEMIINAKVREDIEINIHKMPKPLIPLLGLILEQIKDIERLVRSTDLIEYTHD